MPEYEYRCKNCQQIFSVERSMSESSLETAVACAHCGGSDTARVWGANFISAGAKGSSTPVTVGAGTGSEMCASNASLPKSCCPCS